MVEDMGEEKESGKITISKVRVKSEEERMEKLRIGDCERWMVKIGNFFIR